MSLPLLPVEILTLIFSHVLASDSATYVHGENYLMDSPPAGGDALDLLECALVSKSRLFAEAALALLWRRRHILCDDWDRLKSLFSSKRIQHFANYRLYMQELSILCPSTARMLALDAPKLLQHLPRFIRDCPNLTAFNCDFPGLKDDDLWIISQACPLLTALSLISGASRLLGDDAIVALSKNCKHIRHLRLKALGGGANGKGGFSDQALDAICDAWTGKLLTFALEWVGVAGGLSLGSVGNVTWRNGVTTSRPIPAGGTFDPLVPPTPGGDHADVRFVKSLCRVISANQGLRTLSLTWPIGVEEAIQTAAIHLKSLRHFRLGSYSGDLKVVRTMISANRTIRSISLTDVSLRLSNANMVLPARFTNGAIGSAGLDAILAPLSLSPDHSLPSVHDESVESTSLLADSTQHQQQHQHHQQQFANLYNILTFLNLDGVGTLPTILPTLSRFRNLAHLKLSASRLSATMPTVLTDDLAAETIRNLPRLISLELPMVGNPPLVAIAATCPDLQDLDVVDGSQIVDPAIILLAKGCKKLRRLALGSAVSVGDTAMLVLARALKSSLKILELPFAGQAVTSKSLKAFAEECGGTLEVLMNVPACRVGHGELLECLPNLLRLRVLGMCVAGPGITPMNATRYTLTREQQEELIKASCRLKKIVHSS